MLYVEDFKRAYRSSIAIAKHEIEVEELENKKAKTVSEIAKKRIDIKIDMLNYQIGISRGNQSEIEAFIKTIEDPYIMRIFYKRFLEGKSWSQVAVMCSCGIHAREAVRKITERYFASKGITHCPTEV